MHNHAHSCAHAELVHCPMCDVVYCDKCGREWGVMPMYRVYQYPPLRYPTDRNWTATGGGTSDIGVTTHNHAAAESIDKSIRDNADVWQELAKR